MTPEESELWKYVYSKMNHEGFHYCFKHYSNFKEIDDKEFHRIRKKYLEISSELESYVKTKYQESKDEEMNL